MSYPAHAPVRPSYPAPATVLELLKPVTWFPPMWAFACGVVSSGAPAAGRWGTIAAGIVLAGPMVCAASQAVNDWFDRHVDAINEPDRPIPSGRMPGRWGLWVAILWSLLSLLLAVALGPWVGVAGLVGVALAWAYSAPPVRLKLNGWWGNAAVGACYEGLPWFTGAALMAGGLPDWRVIALAALYSAGAHGIMTLNDFKSVEGDRRIGVGSLPVRLGEELAARVACLVMVVPQLAVVVLLASWGLPGTAALIAGSVLLQGAAMARMLRDPKGLAPWYNGTGVTLYVAGMMAAAVALGGAHPSLPGGTP